MASPLYAVEHLGPQHDRAAFSCGVPDLDAYLQRQAGQDAKRRVAAPFVLVDHTGQILGYYTLSAYSILLKDLPEQTAKKVPKYPVLPATLLGRLAISFEHQKQKLGQFLLMDALRRSWKNTSEVASVGVVVDAYNDAARSFYRRHEFIPLSEHPNRLFISMRTIEKAFIL